MLSGCTRMVLTDSGTGTVAYPYLLLGFLFIISMYRPIRSSLGKKRASPNGGALYGLLCCV